MMTTKLTAENYFVPGDIVRCRVAGGNNQLVNGAIYTIKRVLTNFLKLEKKGDIEERNLFFGWRFDLYNPDTHEIVECCPIEETWG